MNLDLEQSIDLGTHFDGHFWNRYQKRTKEIWDQWKARGGKVVGLLGSDIPEEVLLAGGLLPVRITGDERDLHSADHYLEFGFEPMVRAQFARIVKGIGALDYLIVSSSSDAYVRIFYYLKTLRQTDPHLPIPELYFFDFLHSKFRTSALYNRERVRELIRQVEKWSGRSLNQKALIEAVQIYNRNRDLLREIDRLRQSVPAKMSGTILLKMVHLAMMLPKGLHNQWLENWLKDPTKLTELKGPRLFLCGSAHDHPEFYDLVESCGATIIGEDHDFGTRYFEQDVTMEEDLVGAIVDRYHRPTASSHQSGVSERVQWLKKQINDLKPDGVIFYIRNADDAPSWDYPEQARLLTSLGIPYLVLERQPYRIQNRDQLKEQVESFIDQMRKPSAQRGNLSSLKHGATVVVMETTDSAQTDQKTTAETRDSQPKEPGKRVRRKRLETAKEATRYQKEWFTQLRERVAEGEPFAIVNADVPQEIFRAMDIPYVVNQWWSSVCSAKQMSPYLLGLLGEDGYRTDLCRYCSLALATSMDPEPEKGPWGGLPRPTLAVARLTCDSQAKIFELMSKNFNIPFYALENTIPTVTPPRWWEKAARDWESLFEPHRLDLMVKEFEGLIRYLEVTTGKTFDESKFRTIMNRVNEQAEYNRKTRDLIAEAEIAPVHVTDTIPAVMIPQWHRGTEWAVHIARSLYEEVRQMVCEAPADKGKKQVRLMWLGRGLWFNLDFYHHFEERYNAVFVWSIYLALAADAYARYGGDPLRALASRFAGMEDMLHMPPWNSEWYVKEALNNRIDGVVHLISNSCTQSAGGSYFVKKALEEAGIPVLQLRADPVDARAWDDRQMIKLVEEFLENQVGVKP